MFKRWNIQGQARHGAVPLDVFWVQDLRSKILAVFANNLRLLLLIHQVCDSIKHIFTLIFLIDFLCIDLTYQNGLASNSIDCAWLVAQKIWATSTLLREMPKPFSMNVNILTTP